MHETRPGASGRLSAAILPFLAVFCLVVATARCDRGEVPEDAAPAPPLEADPQRVVARVDGEPIHAAQLDAVLVAERARLGAAGDQLGESELIEMRRRALDLVISGVLVHRAALAAGLVAPEEEIDRRLEVARSQFQDEATFLDYLRKSELTPETFREQERRRMVMEAYVQQIGGEPPVDEREARNLYERQKDRFREEEQLRAAQILIRLPAEPTPEQRAEARSKIDEAHRRAVAGEDFGELARELSESPLAAQAGELGFFPRGRMPEGFDAVVFDTAVDAITPVFETTHGYNVVKVLERREARTSSYEQVRTGLLMMLAREKKERAVREHVLRLREQSRVEILDPELRPAG